ncbi:MAG: extracellular solute-binding protein, partial [Oscillospiraceae bacterium]
LKNNNKIKKFVAIGASLCLAASLFTGCGQTGKPEATGKTKITVWSSERHDMDIRKAQIAKYNAENTDNIEIVYEVKTDDINEMLKMAYQSGNAPDIHTEIDANLEQAAIKSGWIAPLEPSFTDEYKEKMAKGAVVPSIDGKVYKIAFKGPGAFKFIWNKQMFKDAGLDPEAPPKTWDKVREYAKVLTAKGEGKKYGFALPLKDPVFTRYYVSMPGAPSGLYNSDGWDPAKGKYEYSMYKTMINFYRDLGKDGSLFPTPGTLDNDFARAQFSEGNIGMMFGAPWDVGVFNDQFPCKMDWGVTDFPTLTGEVKGGYPAGACSGGYNINAKTKDKEKQMKVYKWLISEENLKELQLAGKDPAAYLSLMKPEFRNTEKKGAAE